jgi:hypothetical protein
MGFHPPRLSSQLYRAQYDSKMHDSSFEYEVRPWRIHEFESGNGSGTSAVHRIGRRQSDVSSTVFPRITRHV